ncbi:MAG: hypothetical protein BGP06_11165 [Rhizobiales bacterium 65-9]|nr:SAM-dependent methyltransferase [Hyphomicrobiales bacterium]OJY32885.1 MAG: hypothetical protein BGP06_11165 [Rhizobiales bacterium 65-9]
MTPLQRRIVDIIRRDGPISVETYMALCLGDPAHGYYMTRDPLGPGGDFTTSPEISQMFGEMIGVWIATAWGAMGAPPKFSLVELGPGRGALMADALRALRAAPDCLAAAHVELVEISPVLREKQRAALASAPAPVVWRDGVEQTADGPFILVANEFFDALPIRQCVRRDGETRERRIACDADGALIFADDGGAISETCPAGEDVTRSIAARLVKAPGAALIIDYGHAGDGEGDTLQAMRAHAFVDPLASPGECDITAHVNFGALLAIARAGGAATQGPVSQADYLRAMGIETRAAMLAKRADDRQKLALASALARLTDVKNARAMGALFKAIALRSPGLPPMPGFDR